MSFRGGFVSFAFQSCMRGILSGSASSRLAASRSHANIGCLSKPGISLKPAHLQQLLVQSPSNAADNCDRAQSSYTASPAGFTCAASSFGLMTNASTTLSPSSASQRLAGRCNGYVGEGTAPAGEYHHADFSWQDHCKEVLALIASNPVKWRHLAHDSLPDSSQSSYPLPAQQDPQDSRRAVGTETYQPQPSGGPHSESHCDETQDPQDPQPSADLRSSSPTIKAQDAEHPSGVQSSSKGSADEAARPDGAKAGADEVACNIESSHQVPSGPADSRPAPVSSDKQAWGNAAATVIPPEASRQEHQLDAARPSMPGHSVSEAHPAGQTVDGGQQLQAEHPSAASPPAGLVSQCRERVAADDGQEGASGKEYSSSRWEAFHAQDNRSGRFYKERRWASSAAADSRISSHGQPFLRDLVALGPVAVDACAQKRGGPPKHSWSLSICLQSMASHLLYALAAPCLFLSMGPAAMQMVSTCPALVS